MKKLLLAILAAALLSSPALADWTGKDASGATITFKNANTCSSVVCVPIAQPVDSTGAAFGVTGNPYFISFGTGVTLPAFAATPTFNLGTLNGAATAAIQGATTDTPCTLPASATACSQVAVEKAIANAANSPPPLGTSGGITPSILNALSTTVKAIKSSAAGQLYMLQCGNTNASEGYVQVFDVATAGGVTLGTTTPKMSIPIAATSTGGFAMSLVGFQFANGIQVAATTTATGSTALGTALDCNAGFN